jgi:copper chaperone
VSTAYSGGMTTQTFHATGLTCGHCAAAVQEELTALPGVQSADVVPVKDGVSTITVTAERDLADDEVAAALDEAGGYALASAGGA